MRPLKDYMLDPPDVIYPRCPVCGNDCETIYKLYETGEIIGCENDISENSADAMPECFPEEG